jgi:site-specific recombinase XerD
MSPKEKRRFEQQHDKMVQDLVLQGYSDKTVDVYTRGVRRLVGRYNKCPDKVSKKQLKDHFSLLVSSHSWSTIKTDRNGLMFFWYYVLGKDWQWVDIVKPPQVKSLPVVLTMDEIRTLMATAQLLRYRVFILVTYSLGLRLSESLNLQVQDIDSGNRRVHVRRGKGAKDRFVPLPAQTLSVMRQFWSRHRHPLWLFPRATDSQRIHLAKTHMSYSGTQVAIRQIVQNSGIKKKPRLTH